MNEELKVIISAEIKKLQDAVGKAKKSIATFAKDAKEKVNKFGEEFSKVGEKAKQGLAIVGGAVAGAAAALLSLSSSTQEYRTAQAKLNTAFETAGASAGTAKKVYNDLYRVLGDSDVAVEAANHLAQITTNEKELSEWTTISKGVFATWGDSIEQAGFAEAINHTIKLGEVQSTLADGLEWAGISVEDFNAKLATCNTEEERAALIKSTLNGLYGEAAANYETNAAGLLAYNEAQAKMAEASARVGEALQPIMTALTTLGADILTALAPYIEQFAAEHLPAITEALAGVGEKIGVVIGWIVDNWELVSTIGTIILGIVATLATLSIAISAVSTVLTIATSPITLVVLGIAALVAAIVLCVKHWDEIKAKVKEVADNIVKWIQDMVAKVGTWFSNMKEKMATAVSNAKEAVVNKFNEIKQGITDKINAAKTSVTTAVTNIVTSIKEKFNTAKTSVLSIFENIKKGLTDKITAAKNSVKTVIDTIKGFFNFKFEMPHIPKPSFGISPAGWKVGDLLKGSIPKLTIKWNALGGVFDSPSIVPYGNTLQGLGEAGAEAIVPLEKNTKWLDVIADKLAGKQGNKPIVLMVDGKVFAQTTIDSINQLTKQTGSLALNII